MAVLVPMVMRVLVRVAVPRAVGVDMFLLAASALAMLITRQLARQRR